MNRTTLTRRILRHSLRGLSQPDADITTQISRRILLDNLRDDNAANNQTRKGLLLYEQQNDSLEVFSKDTVLWDQIPFTALLDDPDGVNQLLPADDYSLLLSNLAFDWVDAGRFIGNVKDLLGAHGRFWFTAFGAGTAITSRGILAEIDSYVHFNDFYEMQEIGDALLGAGFKDVSVVSSSYTLEYSHVDVLLADAYRIFAINTNEKRRHNLGGRGVLEAFKARVGDIIAGQGVYAEQVEIVVAHGRKASADENGSTIAVRMGE